MKKKIAEIYAEKIECKKPVINWEYFESFSAHTLIGILNVMIQELVDLINEESLENAPD